MVGKAENSLADEIEVSCDLVVGDGMLTLVRHTWFSVFESNPV